jgi:copper chaperone CopZ
MKKSVLIALLAVLMLSFAGCGDEIDTLPHDTQETGNTETPTESTTTETTTLTTPTPTTTAATMTTPVPTTTATTLTTPTLTTTTALTVSGMSCGRCVTAVRNVVSALDGVINVSVVLNSGLVTVEHNPGLSVTEIREAITTEGFSIV